MTKTNRTAEKWMGNSPCVLGDVLRVSCYCTELRAPMKFFSSRNLEIPRGLTSHVPGLQRLYSIWFAAQGEEIEHFKVKGHLGGGPGMSVKD